MVTVLQKVLHCKKRLEIFPSPPQPGCHQPNSPRPGIIKGTGKSLTFFSVYGWYLVMKGVPKVSYFAFFAVYFLMFCNCSLKAHCCTEDLSVLPKEDIKEQPTSRNLSATATRVLKCTCPVVASRKYFSAIGALYCCQCSE